MRELNALASCELVDLDGMDVTPTDVGRLMARYYMALDSMKTFMQVRTCSIQLIPLPIINIISIYFS